jgi:hypothetical protein
MMLQFLIGVNVGFALGVAASIAGAVYVIFCKDEWLVQSFKKFSNEKRAIAGKKENVDAKSL